MTTPDKDDANAIKTPQVFSEKQPIHLFKL